MLIIIFLLLLIAVLVAWRGHRALSIYLFVAVMALSIFWFVYNITSTLAIQL